MEVAGLPKTSFWPLKPARTSSEECQSAQQHGPQVKVPETLFTLSCREIVAGAVGTIPVKVRFTKEGFSFICPDYSCDKLYTVFVRPTDITGVNYFFASDLRIVFISVSLVFRKLMCTYLYPQLDHEDFQVISMNLNESDNSRLKGLLRYFPQTITSALNLSRTLELQKLYKPHFLVNKEKLRFLKKTDGLIINNVVPQVVSDLWDELHPNGVPDRYKLGRTLNYLSSKHGSTLRTRNSERGNVYGRRIHRNPASKWQFGEGRSHVVSPDPTSNALSLSKSAAQPQQDKVFCKSQPGEGRSHVVSPDPTSNTLGLSKSAAQPQQDKVFCKSAFEPEEETKMAPAVPNRICNTIGFTSEKKTCHGAESPESEEHYYVVYPPPPEPGGLVIMESDLACLRPGEWLNDTIVDFWFKYVYLTKCTLEEQRRVLFFGSFFCTLLASVKTTGDAKSLAEAKYERARRWTRKQNIFQMEFLVFPVHRRSHWFLVIVCFPGEVTADLQLSLTSASGNSSNELDLGFLNDSSDEMLTRRPCILVFDSLLMKQEDTVEDLRIFLRLEHLAQRGFEVPFDPSSMASIHLNVPRQDNSHDCGVFLLQFLDSFCQTLLKNFEVPLTNFEEWFLPSDIRGKRKELLALLASLHDQQMSEDYLKPRDVVALGHCQHLYSP